MAQNKKAEGQFRGAVLTQMHVLGLLEEAGEATQGEHKTLQGKLGLKLTNLLAARIQEKKYLLCHLYI